MSWEIENKTKNKDFEINIDIYRNSDSGNRFSGKFYIDFMSSIFFFICLNTIKVSFEFNANFSKKSVFRRLARVNL